MKKPNSWTPLEIGDSQLYKLAGNSICVDCMVGIFRNAFSTEEHDQLTLF